MTFSIPYFCSTCQWVGDFSEVIPGRVDRCPNCKSEGVEPVTQCSRCLQPIDYCNCIENALDKSAREFLEDLANEDDGKLLALVEAHLNAAKARLAGLSTQRAEDKSKALVRSEA